MKFKERSKITFLDGESRETLRKLTDAEVLYNTTRADRGAAMQRLASVKRNLSAQRGELVPSVMSLASPSAQSLKAKLVALQTQYAQLVVQDYAIDHPQLVRLRQEIELTKKALTDEAMKLAKGGSVGDPIAQIERYVQESVSLEIEIESLKARENALKRTVEEYRQVLSNLPTKEVELARLVRERDVSEKIYTNLLEKREEIRISEAKQIPNTRVIDLARLPKDPIKPRKRLNVVAGVTLGLILGLGVGLFLENGAKRLGSMVEFERETGWPVLGMVPLMKGGPAWWIWPWGGSRQQRGSEGDRRKALVSDLDPQSAVGESYFMLRTRLELLGMGRSYRSLLVTSSGPRDGKSTTLCNLAATFGAAGRAALVVDAELRRPVIHSILGVHKGPGLTDLLLGRNGDGTSQRVEEKKAYQQTKVNGVTVIASGKRVQETQWEVCRAKMGALLDELGRSYDVVLVDSASPILVHDTLALCGMVDAVLMVVDAQSYDVHRLMETRRLLERSGANVVGVVVNRIDPSGTYSYYYSHHYSHDDSRAERSVES
jgi:tyrosine-protein kinase Etk/Wzc